LTYLLDTNVVSEWVKPRPDEGVMAWFRNVSESDLFLSVVTLAELRQGIERLPAGARRTKLDVWLTDQLALRFEERTLSVGGETADIWGRITARAKRRGFSVEAMDGLIGALALQHDLSVVTRNVTDFAALDVRLVNPWTGP
jgi:predicted nucleic acid-binding protein